MAMRRFGVIVLGFVVSMPAIASAQGSQSQVVVGQQLFETYCIACHGAGGKGDGQLAKSRRKAPANLTELSKKSEGKFPTERVLKALEGTRQPALHADMPVWAEMFAKMSDSPDRQSVQFKLESLAKYLETIQAKP